MNRNPENEHLLKVGSFVRETLNVAAPHYGLFLNNSYEVLGLENFTDDYECYSLFCEDLGDLITIKVYLNEELAAANSVTRIGRSSIFKTEEYDEVEAITFLFEEIEVDFGSGTDLKKSTIEKPLAEPFESKKGFDSIAGMESLKQQMRDEVLFPLNNKDLMAKYHIHPINGMLLYGPPGCGKTYFAEKFAEESGMNFLLKRSGEISGKYIHETANAIRDLFVEAKEMAPCILCIDEIDALVPCRVANNDSGATDQNESVNEFLSQMNNCGHHGIFVIGTTNMIDNIDSALLRTGRMDALVYVPMPDKESRKAMLQLHLEGRPLEENLDFDTLAEYAEGMNASDIETMVNATALKAARSLSLITFDMLAEQAKTQRRSNAKAEVKSKKIGTEKVRPIIGFSAYKEQKKVV